MPISLRSENLKPIISVQNLVLRSMSLTFKTTCPIFLIFIGDFSSAIVPPRWSANWFSNPRVNYAHPDRRLCITETASRQNVQDSQHSWFATTSVFQPVRIVKVGGSNLMSDSQAIYPPFPRPYAIDHTC